MEVRYQQLELKIYISILPRLSYGGGAYCSMVNNSYNHSVRIGPRSHDFTNSTPSKITDDLRNGYDTNSSMVHLKGILINQQAENKLKFILFSRD